VSEVLVQERGPVAVITLNRPDALNTFTRELRLAVLSALQRCASSDSVRAVVLTGAGRGFSAGVELAREMPSIDEAVRQLEEEFNPGIRAIVDMPKPVIAGVNGFATGIGASYALACDMVLMGEGAFMQVPFARIGLVPDGGACWQLAERLGPRVAFEVAMMGDRLPAARCVALGLANRAVPDATLVEECVSVAARLAECAPIALASTKRLLRSASALGLEGTLRAEATEQARCIGSADFLEGVRAFLEKRPPRFSGK
jgi:2-(1,2-epoxy-1,2-dihydrophenyl)acetyl-CoA isomerase